MLLEALDDKLRKIAVWKLEGWTNREIGEKINRTERTVGAKLDLIRTIFRERGLA